MNFKWNETQAWLDARRQREVVLIFMAGFAIIYLIWGLIIKFPLDIKKERLEKKYQQLTAELNTVTQQLTTLERVIATSSFIQQMTVQNKGQQLKAMEFNFVPIEWLSKVTNDLIAQQGEVTLVSLKTFPAEPWSMPKSLSLSTSPLQNVYKHKMQIEFRGSYFNTIEFLTHLEKLSWRIYWDSLEYKVLTYPDAQVIAQFYVLSEQKG